MNVHPKDIVVRVQGDTRWEMIRVAGSINTPEIQTLKPDIVAQCVPRIVQHKVCNAARSLVWNARRYDLLVMGQVGVEINGSSICGGGEAKKCNGKSG